MVKLGLAIAAGMAALTCAAADVARQAKRREEWESVVEILREIKEMFGSPVSRLRPVVGATAVRMHTGLASKGSSSRFDSLRLFLVGFPSSTSSDQDVLALYRSLNGNGA